MGGDAQLQLRGSISQLLAQLQKLSLSVGEAPSVDAVLRDVNALLDLAQLRPQVEADRRWWWRGWLHGGRDPSPCQLTRRPPSMAAMRGKEGKNAAQWSLREAALQVLGRRWRGRERRRWRLG